MSHDRGSYVIAFFDWTAGVLMLEMLATSQFGERRSRNTTRHRDQQTRQAARQQLRRLQKSFELGEGWKVLNLRSVETA
jgi:SAM-dependent MidA family methyltransferase